MNLYSDCKLLDDSLVILTGKDDSARSKAASDLKAHVELAARELSLERFAKFENDLYQIILSSVNGATIGEKVGGILAIRELIDCTSASAEIKVIKFAKTLSNALHSSTDFSLIELIADAFGHMARNSPVSDVDYLEGELSRSLDWLRASKNSVYKRFAACVMLQQLAQNAPTIFFARVNEFFDLIWGPIWDNKEMIRQVAGRALSACLSVLRERTYHLQWYCYTYDQLQEGFHNGTEEFVHGSLLVVTEVLKYTGDFMIPRFKDVCKALMRLKDHKSKIVRSAIITLLPSLANLCPDAFARAHMDESMEFLLKSMKSSDLRPQALLATGKLCLAVGSHLVSRIDELIAAVKDTFVISHKRSSKHTSNEVVPEAFQCVADMVRGLGAPFHARIGALLESILQAGLTAELIETLTVISTYMPNQKPIVQKRLLEEATKVLGGNEIVSLPDPDYTYSWSKRGVLKDGDQSTNMKSSSSTANLNRVASTRISASSAVLAATAAATTTQSLAKKSKKTFSFIFSKSSKDTSSGQTAKTGVGVAAIGLGLGLGTEMDSNTASNHTYEIVLLSLKTLATLTMPSFSLIHTIQRSVLPYLNSDDYLVRREAAVTCAKMTSSLIVTTFSKGPTSNAIEDIVFRLLEMAVADTSSIVRQGVLQSFSKEFDRYLSRAHHIDTLMLLLADELFEIKLLALSILGRLASTNAAAVLPPIRVHLTQLISELQNSPDYHMVEEAATLLCNLMKFSKFHFLIKPVMQTVLDSLPLRGDVRATTSALETVGELAVVLQQDLAPYADSLLPFIVANMFDASSLNRQEVAVRTLGQFCKSTGLAVRPYLIYPHLLPKTLDLLCRNRASKPSSLRMEILRTLGLLGALEPSRYAAITSFLQAYFKKKIGKNGQAEERVECIEKMLKVTKNNLQASSSLPVGSGTDRDIIRASLANETNATKERSESNMSMSFHEKVMASGRYEADTIGAANKPNSFVYQGQDRRIGGQNNGFVEYEEVMKSEILLQGDNGDAPAHLFMYEQSVMRAIADPPNEKMFAAKHSPSNPDFFPRVTLSALVKILQDPALSLHHSTATQTIIQIFSGLGVRCVPFLEQIVPYFLQIVRKSATGLRESILQQLSQLVAIIGHYITPYLPNILEILRDYWSEHLEFVLGIVQQVAVTTSDTFATYLPTLLPLLLSNLVLPRDINATSLHGNSQALKPLEDILNCVKVLRVSLRPHLHLFIPPLCKLMSGLQALSPETLSTQALVLQTIRYLITRSKGAVVEQSHVILSNLVHTICKSILRYSSVYSSSLSSNAEVYLESIAILTSLAEQCGQRILKFDSLILRATESKGLDISSYKEITNLIRSGYHDEMRNYHVNDDEMLSLSSSSKEDIEESGLMGIKREIAGGLSLALPQSSNAPISNSNNFYTSVPKLLLNQQQLARSWDVSQRSTATDWHEWLWRFNVDLIRESPSPTLRACAPLAQSYPPLARELFHAAFVSCWHELTEPYQESLVRALQTAFRSASIPSDILQHLLNLAEFMEHDVEALPISLSILAELAQKGHAYAKALHYRELEYQTNPAGCFENLININKKLDQYDAASGLLKVAEQISKRYPELKEFYTVQESWLAKLGFWDEALAKYDLKLNQNPRDYVAIAGKVKCLEALGRWEEAVKLCEEHLDVMRVESESNQSNTHTKAAVIGARAAWSLNEWKLMDKFVTQLPANNVDRSFLKAVLAVHEENYEESKRLMEETRKHLDKSIAALMTESYGRAYMPLILAQQCSELEEITEYKLFLKEAGLTEQLAELTPVRNSLRVAVEQSSYEAVVQQQSDSLYELPRKPNRHMNLSECLAAAPTNPSALTAMMNNNAHESGSSSVVAASVDSGNKSVVQEAVRRKALVLEKWRKRIRGCCSTGRAAIPYWKYLLNGRRMVLSEREDLDTWLDFVSLCRNGGNPTLAERVLAMCKDSSAPSSSPVIDSLFSISPGGGLMLGGPLNHEDEVMIMDRRIQFAVLKQEWAVGDKLYALAGLERLVKQAQTNKIILAHDPSYLSCLLKLGEWKIAMLDPSQSVDVSTRMEVLQLYSHATQVDPSSYLAWHQWALSNYRAIEEARGYAPGRVSFFAGGKPHHPGVNPYSSNSILAGKQYNASSYLRAPAANNNISKEQLTSFAINAIKGFMRALTLGKRKYSSSVTQDMLCVLTLWFRYGRIPDVNSALQEGLGKVALDNWLGVLPQLIARIDHPDRDTRQLLHNLLVRIGMKHAQALVYPLSVALKSPRDGRKEAAESLMNSLRQHSTKLIDQALLVSQELVRVAILWEESWHWALEDASRQYYGEGNVQAMLNTLIPLHEAVEKGPSTLREIAFVENYRHDLTNAWDFLKSYMKAMEEKKQPIPTQRSTTAMMMPENAFISQAWDLYYTVFKRINTQLPHINSLDLQSCSPSLFSCHDMDVGVPGTYTVTTEAVRIKSFNPIVAIIRSKQRPRKLRIIGEDGQEFGFLLKGNEDLRQDERAMQLFGLVNALLYHDRRTGVNGDDLQIQRYAVMPLSPVVGLIGWVPNCDTLHDLIRNYRESRKIMLDVEHRLILQVAPGKLYDTLPPLHKLEVFEHAMAYTAGEDLAKILWLKSENSESWLQRRTTYTRSLAVMSMVGYILGLGDRHPSNLMLDRKTGKIIHIDFGDCFEVAKHREKYPEKVPFRLTRMLVNAMEVARIEGNFRSTCEKVMAVLRENRDSLVATLEAFVHDPLISWRLMNIATNKKGQQGKSPVVQQNTSSASASAQTNAQTQKPRTYSINNTAGAVQSVQSAQETSKPSTLEADKSSAETASAGGGEETTAVYSPPPVVVAGNRRPRTSSITKPFVQSLTPILERSTSASDANDVEKEEENDEEEKERSPAETADLPAPPVAEGEQVSRVRREAIVQNNQSSAALAEEHPPAESLSGADETNMMKRPRESRPVQLNDQLPPSIHEDSVEKLLASAEPSELPPASSGGAHSVSALTSSLKQSAMGDYMAQFQQQQQQMVQQQMQQQPVSPQGERDPLVSAQTDSESGESKLVNASSLVSKTVGFANHTAAHDVVSASFARDRATLHQHLLQASNQSTDSLQHQQTSSSNDSRDSIYGVEEHSGQDLPPSGSQTAINNTKATGASSSAMNNNNNNNSGKLSSPPAPQQHTLPQDLVVQQFPALDSAPVSKNSSKTVSFSQLNQTIEANNTIRQSSTSVAIESPHLKELALLHDEEDNSMILPIPPATSAAANNNTNNANSASSASTTNTTNNNNLPGAGHEPAGPANSNASKPTNSSNVIPPSLVPPAMIASNNSSNNVTTAGNVTAAASNVTSAVHPPSSYRPGLNNNLHIELTSLANSISQAGTTRMIAASGRYSGIISSSAMAMSVKSFVGSAANNLNASSHQQGFDGSEDDTQQQELIEKAVVVIRRVQDKLTGLDFSEASSANSFQNNNTHSRTLSFSIHGSGNIGSGGHAQALEVPEQVERLIREATSNENLSQSFFGWCPFW